MMVLFRALIIVITSFGLLLPCSTAAQNTGKAQLKKKPNVLLIYTDDQGTVDLNCYGARDLHTPHIDGLAKRGLRFTRFYTAAPVCSPSRAALITGRYPQRAGLATNAASDKGGHGAMPASQVTMAEIFQSAGYATGHIGKWHMGYSPATMPNQQGFDYSFGHMGGCIDNYSHYFYWQGPNRHDLWRNGVEVWQDGKFFPDLMVEEVNQFLEKNKTTPFYLYWALNIPHYPLQGQEKWRKHYQNLPSPRREYAALVSTMDEKVGAVLQKLKELKLEENTIIVFQSDHGHSEEERTFGGGGSAGPFRGAKFSLFEGGIRVPAIISWPGVIAQDQVRSQFCVNVDWFPTLAELCQVPLPNRIIDGKSLVPLIRSKDSPSPHPVFFWQSGGSKEFPQWAVREGDWKLLHNPLQSDPAEMKDDRLFLVNMKQDSTERRNLASQHPDMVSRLKAKYTSWIKEAENQ